MHSMKKLQNFINGEFKPCSQLLDSYNPSTGEVWAQVPDSGAAEICDAVRAATGAFKTWSKTAVEERCKILLRIADLIDENKDMLAEVESRDQGKPESFSKNEDIPSSADNFRQFANTIPHILGTAKVSGSNAFLNYTTNNPVGVCGLITPWNFPLPLVTSKVAAAISCGNTCVVKPSEMTSASAYEFCKLVEKAGVPAGVINVVFGSGASAGEALINNRDVSLISFTGSTATGTHIAEVAAPMNKRIGLEMGGKNPSIVFADCNLKEAVASHIMSSFVNTGQVCICTSRIYVQKEIFQKFLSEFVKEAEKLKVGPCTDKDAFLGPVNSKRHMEKVQRYIQLAIKDGGKIECGESLRKAAVTDEHKNGYYLLPTIITGLQDTSMVMRDEIFGPVTVVSSFVTEEEAIERANDTKYGLAATVWTSNSATAQRVANQIDAGAVWVNTWGSFDDNFPFGGFKCSGIGREGLYDSFQLFTEKKTICTNLKV